MATKRLPVRRIREILRLKFDKRLTHRDIAKACSVGAGTVSQYVARAERAGLTWPIDEGLDDAALEAMLFETPAGATVERPAPDYAHVHEELKRPGVTLQLLWLEYLDRHPDGYRYSRYCELYRRWAKKLSPTMRQLHRAGEKAFVDFAGKRPQVVDRRSGRATPVGLFVGVLGASNYTYAEATPAEDLSSWIQAHVHMVEYIGGCPAVFVPDNLRSGVVGPCRYEPSINRTYEECARHYGAVVIPTRVAKPRDKAKVEVAVQLVERWIVAALRNRTFFSLPELNTAIRELLKHLNERPQRGLSVSRRELYERLDRPALRPLPPQRYEMAQWKPCRVNIDYHIEVDRNFYSVPFQLIHQAVEARFTQSTVEVFFKSKRVASHARLRGRSQASTHKEHMPRSHRAHAEWSPSRLIAWAENTGPATGRVVEEILRGRPHPEQGYRACLGLLRLGKRHGADRLEAACRRAVALGSFSYRTVKNIISTGMDRLPLEGETTAGRSPLSHENLRGAAYYARKESEC